MKSANTHRVLAVLVLKVPVPSLLSLTSHVTGSMGGNKWFTTPVPSLATVTADAGALASAETVAATHAKGSVADRNAKEKVLKLDLTHLKAYVQAIADANPEDAEAIILSAGMAVRKPANRTKDPFTVKQTTVSGEAHLVVRAAGARASYEWAYSTDQKTWTALPTTLQARTKASNLAVGTTVYFRYRAVTKTGVGDWSDPVSLVIR